ELWLIGNDDVVAMADLANIWVVAGGERKHLWWVGLLALGGCGWFNGSAGSWLLGWLLALGCGGVIRKRTLVKAQDCLVLPFHTGLTQNT
ncbi:unnamed protein product, partial [Prunus brigantina]